MERKGSKQQIGGQVMEREKKAKEMGIRFIIGLIVLTILYMK